MPRDTYEMISGVIKRINVSDEKKSLLIVDEKGFEYIFHINEHTIIMTFEDLKVG
ncbi:hypothetical protein R9X47_00665 [Wukongibacter baidiensis]|uniref:hypothetical protein n=1 Tax=Wukongibacter baidiensis TaxID=1723361 RepID=UPI003D7FD36B